MKTSNIKTSYSLEQVKDLPEVAEGLLPQTFTQLTEGHFSQAFAYETDAGDKRVIRLGRKLRSFKADKYAHDHFESTSLPIPEVLDIGEVEPGLFYCISEFVPGTPSDQLSAEDFLTGRADMEQAFASIFITDIGHTTGYGDIDLNTGNGKDSSFQDFLRKEIKDCDIDYLRQQCSKTELDPGLVDAFFKQFDDNIQQAQAKRRLIHGDLGGDNLIVSDGKVAAVIDWSGMGYGDWLHDYSRIEFWYPGRQTPASQYAHTYELETENYEARWLAHTAAHAISTLSFAFRYESTQIQEWLQKNLPSKLPGLSS